MIYRGMNRRTGKALSGRAHLEQSIRDILSTPLGTRAWRRDYGCRLFDLLDQPTNSATLLEIYAAVAWALSTWEPRFTLTQVVASSVGNDGKLSLDLTGLYRPNGQEIVMEGLVL